MVRNTRRHAVGRHRSSGSARGWAAQDRRYAAHPDAARWIGRLAQSSLGAGAGGATPLGDSCSHAPVAAVTAKSPYTNNYLAPGSACPEGVNIRWRLV